MKQFSVYLDQCNVIIKEKRVLFLKEITPLQI